MSFEVNKKGLSGQTVKIIDNALLKADLNNNRKIDNEQEELLFNYQVESSDVLTRSEKKQILGEKKVKEDSDAKQARQERKADKKTTKGSKENFIETLDTFAKNGMTRAEVLDELKETLITNGGTNAKEKYEGLINVVREVLEIMPKEYDRMNDIDSNLGKIKSQFGENDEVHRAVLKSLRQMAKNEKRQAAYVDITNRFAKEIEADLTSGAKRNDEEIMDKILQDLKDERLYLNRNSKHTTYREQYQNEYVTAFDAYVNNEVMKDVRILLTQVIMGNDEDIKGTKIHKKAKDFLKDNGFYDKYVKKADKQNRYGRKTSKAQALENKVELNTVQSAEALKGALKDKTEEAKLEALMTATTTLLDARGEIILDDENGEPQQFNLISKREDGYYDLSVLSSLIREAVGSDNTRNKHKEKAIAELTRIMGNVNKSLVGQSEDLQLTKEEVLNLVDLCGYDTKGNGFNWLKAALGAAGGALAHGATAAAATWSNPYQTYLDCPPDVPDIEIENNINISEDIKDALSGFGINIELGITVQTIIKDIMANEQAFLVVMPKLIAENAIKSAVLGGILGLLNGIQEHEEIPVGSIKVEDATLQDYSDRLKAEGNKYAKLFTAIAVAFGYVDEDGTLDREGLQKFLGSVLAGNDILNKQELYKAVSDAYNTANTHRLLEKPAPVEETKEEEKEPVDNTPKNIEGSKSQYEHKYTVEHDILVVNARKSNWENIVDMYDNCIVPNRDAIDREKYPNCYRRYSELEVRFIKVAQAINNGDYSLEHLLDLAEATFAAKTSKYTELKDRTDIDHSALLSAINSDWLTEVKVPKKLGECTRVKDTPDAAGKMNTEGAKNAPTGYARDTEKSYHTKDVYGLQVGNGAIETFEDMQARDNRYAELVKQNREAGYTVTTVEKLTPQEVEDAYKKKDQK